MVAAYAYFGIRWYNTGDLSPLPLPVSAADTSVDETPVSAKQVQDYVVSPEAPRYLEIQKLGITQSRVTKVGLTANHMLDVPRNLADTGWYAKSATPGSGVGAVLIDGHSTGVSRSGVFAKLSSLQKGDQVTIERGDGKSFTYEVYDVRDMTLDQVNKTGMKEMMYSVDPSKEGLSLISSSGKWIPKAQVFDHRILVRATIVD
jgi:sortase (surface protein transpeptidase)